MRLRVFGLVLVSSIGCREASAPVHEPSDPPVIARTQPSSAPTTAPSPAPLPSSTPTTSSSPAPLPSSAPTSAPSAPVPTSFPPKTDACVTDADCGSTSYGPDCCFRCETSVGDKTWVAKVDAFCASKPGKSCPMVLCAAPSSPSLLGYLNALPKCASGHCIKPH